ncbi:MAG: YfhO family protein [Candidatus Desantisbacteria bacterium]
MKKNILAVLFFIAITIIFFSPVLFTENTFVFRDFYRYYYPFYHLKVSLIKDGIFPFWNPYLFSGTPLFALIQLGTLYPLSIPLYLLPFGLGIKLFIIIHFLLSGIFMYCLGKVLNLKTSASLAAGITFSFSSFSLCMIAHPNILCSMTWMPLILCLYHTALVRRSLSWMILSGVCIALQILAGEPVVSYMTILVLFFYGICSPIGGKYRFITLPLPILIGVGLSLIQLLPFLELTLFSARAHGIGYMEATDWSLHPGELLNLIIPFFSDIMRLPRQGLLLSMYMGIIPLSMICLSIVCFQGGNQKSKIKNLALFWAGGFLISILLSLGCYFFLYELLYQYLPGFNMMRHAVKFIGIATFCGAVLTGYGFNLLPDRKKEFIWILLSMLMACICLWGIGIIKQGVPFWGQIIGGQQYLPVIPIILILSSLAFLRKKARTTSLMLMLIIMADLFFYGSSLTPVISQKFYDQKPALAEWLERESVNYRYLLNPATEGAHLQDVKGKDITENKCPNLQLAYWHGKSILFCNLGLLWRIPDASGYEAMAIRDYEKFIWHVRNEKLPSIYHLLCMLNVKYIASETPLLCDGLELVRVTQNIRVYKNRGCLPRAFFVPKATVVANKKEAFYYIMRPEFDPTKEVVVFEKVPLSSKIQTVGTTLVVVRIDSYQPNEIIIQAKANTHGFLFLGDAYYPGWKAYQDGKETKIYRANYIFRAIEITPGTHNIKFIYYPQVFKVGMVGSFCTVLLIIIAWVLIHRRKHGKQD